MDHANDSQTLHISEKAMKALFLIQGLDVPSSRYRVLQFLPAWEKGGHSYQIFEHSEALNDTGRILKHAQKSDVIFFHRKRYPLSFLKKIQKLGIRKVYDIDDAVMFRDALKPGRAKSWLRRLRFNRMISRMDQVIVGNSYLAAHSSHSTKKATILPTCLDMKKYPSDWQNESSQPTLVWIGDGGSIHYLEKIRPLLERVGEQIKNCRLKIICNRFFDLDNMEVMKVSWSDKTEVTELIDSQIGLMPLGTDPWSQGKCALKFLQYLASGRPAVVTPVGMNADILKEASCGYGATTEEEWVSALIKLLQDPLSRKKMGQEGFELVRQRYSLEKRAAEWVELVSGASHSKNVKSP